MFLRPRGLHELVKCVPTILHATRPARCARSKSSSKSHLQMAAFNSLVSLDVLSNCIIDFIGSKGRVTISQTCQHSWLGWLVISHQTLCTAQAHGESAWWHSTSVNKTRMQQASYRQACWCPARRCRCTDRTRAANQAVATTPDTRQPNHRPFLRRASVVWLHKPPASKYATLDFIHFNTTSQHLTQSLFTDSEHERKTAKRTCCTQNMHW